MEPVDRDKAAFVTPDCLFQFKITSFGLCNAAATFERFIDTSIRGLKWEICMCYVDDDVISDRMFEEQNTWLGMFWIA